MFLVRPMRKYLHSMSSPSRPNPYSRDIRTGRQWKRSPHWTRRGLVWSPTHRSSTEQIYLSGHKSLIWQSYNSVFPWSFLWSYPAPTPTDANIFSQSNCWIWHLEFLIQPVAVGIFAAKRSLLFSPAANIIDQNWGAKCNLLLILNKSKAIYRVHE